MIHYSTFLKLRIKLCPHCQIAVVDLGYTSPELLQTEKLTKTFIENYFIASKDWKVANSYSRCSHNQNCETYKKFI